MAEPVIVKSVTQKGEKAAMIHFTVGEAAWSPDYATAVKLIGKPLPSDWRLEKGDYGPKALPPKKGGSGGAPAWRNTKEGFLAEQEGRQRWQQVEEDRRDRRTALMQAAPLLVEHGAERVVATAEFFYDWLKDHKTSPAAGPAVTPTEGAATKGEGEQNPRGLAPNGDWDRQPSPAGGTSLAEGEAAGTEPGEGTHSDSGKPSPGFTTKPKDCTHRARIDVSKIGGPKTYVDGEWAPRIMVGGQPRCSLCGTPAVKYLEAV